MRERRVVFKLWVWELVAVELEKDWVFGGRVRGRAMRLMGRGCRFTWRGKGWRG